METTEKQPSDCGGDLDDLSSVGMESAGHVEQKELDTSEQSVVDQFARAFIQFKDFQEACRTDTTELRAECKELRENLEKAMEAADVSCAILENDSLPRGTPADIAESLPKFVRMKRNNSSKTVTPEMVRDALVDVSWDDVEAIFETAKAKKKPITPLEALVKAVVQEVSRRRTNFVMQVTLCNSLERGKNVDTVPRAPRAIVKLCLELHEACERLKTIREKRKGEGDQKKDEMAELQERVDGILSQNHRSDVFMETRTRGAFFVRAKVSRKKPPIKMKELQALILP